MGRKLTCFNVPTCLLQSSQAFGHTHRTSVLLESTINLNRFLGPCRLSVKSLPAAPPTPQPVPQLLMSDLLVALLLLGFGP